jgi:hypothetical protein
MDLYLCSSMCPHGMHMANFKFVPLSSRRSQWPRGLRRKSAAEHFLGSWVRIPPGAWMFVSCECLFLLSDSGLCDGPILRPEESYRLWCVSECDQVKINNLDTYCERVEEGRTTTTS